MRRYYRLIPTEGKPEEEVIQKILQEFCEHPNVESAELVDDGAGIIVRTRDGEFSDVMNLAVNIFAREGKIELSFDHFVPDEA